MNISEQIFNIVKVELRVLEPAKVVIPFQDATMGPFGEFGMAVISLTDQEGLVGESPVYGSYNNILEGCLLPILLHARDLPYQELYKQLYWSIRNEGFKGPASALAGQVDMALHDLAARRAGLPLHRFLQAGRDTVKMYGSGGGTNYSLGELEKEAGFFLAAGADCYKMKVGKDFGTRMKEDVERVKFVRRLLGSEVKLAVDANQIWNCEQALRFIDLTAAEDIAWFEEPIHSAAYEQIEFLCAHTPLTISYGESERSSRVFPTLVNAGVRHLQPVPNHLAGIREWMEVRDLAKNAGIDFSSGGYSLYTACLMATAGVDCRVEYLYSIMAGLERYFSVRPEWKDGCFILPDIAGVPLRVDWEACAAEKRIKRSFVWNKENIRAYHPSVSL